MPPRNTSGEGRAAISTVTAILKLACDALPGGVTSLQTLTLLQDKTSLQAMTSSERKEAWRSDTLASRSVKSRLKQAMIYMGQGGEENNENAKRERRKGRLNRKWENPRGKGSERQEREKCGRENNQ